MANLLAEYRSHYPEVIVDISFEDRLVDLVEEGYDLALRVARTPDQLPSGLIARPARPATFYIAASREYLGRRGVPKSPKDLEHHDFVAAGSLSSLTFMSPKGPFEVPMRVVLRYRSLGGVANAVAAGIGLGPVPALMFEDPVFQDSLIPVLTEHSLGDLTMYFVYVSRKYLPLKLRTFVDFFVAYASRFPRSKSVATLHAASHSG
jgi:DNA-binding transcriptional LysR family regulator